MKIAHVPFPNRVRVIVSVYDTVRLAVTAQIRNGHDLTMKILILGATGTIGHQLAEEIVQGVPQIQLRLTSRRNDGVTQLEREFPDAEICKTDFLDPASLEPAIRGVDKIMVVNPDAIDENRACTNLVEAIGHGRRSNACTTAADLPARSHTGGYQA